MKKSAGIAMIQVLIIVAVLSIFVLYLSSKTSDQLKVARLAQDRALAIVKNHAVTSNILFSLLTNHSSQSPVLVTGSQESPRVELNFYNAPIITEGSVIRVQDQAGLFNVNVFYKDVFKKLFLVNGVDESRAEFLWQMLLDWQDKNDDALGGNEKLLFGKQVRNGFISDLSEIVFITNLSEIEKKIFFENFSLYSVGEINLMAATSDILKAVLGENIAEAALSLRTRGELSGASLKTLIGSELLDNYRFTASSRLAFEVETTVNSVIYLRKQVVSLLPYARPPVAPVNVLQDIK
ncbi:general secretion pathway protein GspK [Thalassotalea sp. G2M2-11]|uniref:general secretion pathway protein GspK n=1 Tax=Thalassotalea sp. G2M2-11 TaxID=2787627 RepID=UPI0019CFE615|nr:general secretion pathway protein GspK [Thalassotalea sp. G2M2-11]